MDDSVCQQCAELAVDVHYLGECRVCGVTLGHCGSLGAQVGQGEEAGEEKWEEELFAAGACGREGGRDRGREGGIGRDRGREGGIERDRGRGEG